MAVTDPDIISLYNMSQSGKKPKGRKTFTSCEAFLFLGEIFLRSPQLISLKVSLARIVSHDPSKPIIKENNTMMLQSNNNSFPLFSQTGNIAVNGEIAIA